MSEFHLTFQFLATFTALLSVLSSGIHEAWTSVYIPKLLGGSDVIKITSEEGSWITLSMGVGGLMGCLIASFFIDKIGRKKTILITSFPFLVSTIVLAYSNSVIMFCLARIISGLSSGVTIAVIPHYLGEIADTEIRGMLGTMVPVFNLIGFLFINIIGSYLTITSSSLISSVIPVLLLLTFVWMPESPHYLVMMGKFDEARKSLIQLKGTSEVSNEFDKLKYMVVRQNQNKGTVFGTLFRQKSNRKALIIVFILLNGKQLTGIGPIDAYAQLIFGEIFDNLSPLLVTILYYSTRLIMVVVSSFITDKIGRRPMLFISFTGSALTLFLVAMYLYFKSNTSVNVTDYRLLPILFLEGFAIFYSFLTSIPLTMLGELFPMNAKAFASVFYEIYLYFITLATIKCFQLTSDHFGMEISFFIFSFSCALHLILIYSFVVETKGKSLDEIQKQLH